RRERRPLPGVEQPFGRTKLGTPEPWWSERSDESAKARKQTPPGARSSYRSSQSATDLGCVMTSDVADKTSCLPQFCLMRQVDPPAAVDSECLSRFVSN